MLIFVELLVKAIVSNQIRIPKLLKVTQTVKLSWLAVRVLLVSLFYLGQCKNPFIISRNIPSRGWNLRQQEKLRM